MEEISFKIQRSISMLAIGLTGSLSTGKTTVAGIFSKKGARVISADKIAHQLLQKGGRCYRQVVKAFGKDILEGSRIDRRKLAQIVFHQPKKRRQLERIVHPKVKTIIKKHIKEYRAKKDIKMIVVEVPLLFEAGFEDLFDKTIVVKVNQKTQMQRAAHHLKISSSEIKKRIRSQMPLNRKIRLADFTIDNSKSKVQTKNEVNKLWQRLLQKTKR